jgi:hypothetical protein
VHHPAVLFSLAGAMISPKFFRKLQYINTLSELAVYVPLTQIDLPAPVYQCVAVLCVDVGTDDKVQGEPEV